MPRYDVFHFNFGQSFLPRLGAHGIDLPLLRAAGKTVIMTYQGCDARQVSYCQKHFALSCCGQQQGDGLCHVRDDAGKEKGIRYASRFAHRLFCLNPDLSSSFSISLNTSAIALSMPWSFLICKCYVLKVLEMIILASS